MAVYEYGCAACGHSAERRASFETVSLPCPSCGLPAVRKSVYPINFGGFAETPLDKRTYWSEFKDFTEAGAELEYKHSRAEEAAGKTLPTPPLARIAKRRAKELMAKGVKSSEDWQSRRER